MNPERMRRLEELYTQASALPEGQRAEFLVQACAVDDSLRREVESLLLCEKAAGSFMEVPAPQNQPPMRTCQLSD
jgi:hypothetical protein